MSKYNLIWKQSTQSLLRTINPIKRAIPFTYKRFNSSSINKSFAIKKNNYNAYIGVVTISLGIIAYTTVTKSISNDEEVEPEKRTKFPLVDHPSIIRLGQLDSPEYCTDEETLLKVFTQIKSILQNDPENFTETVNDLKSHSDTYFNTHHATAKQVPGLVTFPRSTNEVSQIMRLCHKFKIPVIPFSGGTSIEGHFLPTRGHSTVIIDCSKFMNNIIKLNRKDLDVQVQPGVSWEDLNDYLADYNLMLGIDPGPGAQIGGCIANSCSGTNAYRYGTMKENVVNLTVVLPDGSIIRTRGNGRPRKSSAGYNLNGLFVGNEGTLGIVTQATIKCHVKPKFEKIAVVSFPTVGNAAACASALTEHGIQLNAMELLDSDMMKIINQTGQTFRSDWAELPTMFFKIGGMTHQIVDEMVKQLQKIATEHESNKFEFSTSEENKLELWGARKVALWSVIDAGRQQDDRARLWTTDVAVPLSQFSTVIDQTKEDLRKSKLLNAMVGHAGDGNFHAFIIYNNDEEFQTCKQLVERMVYRALKAEGTCTGEHGIGIGKREYLEEELDQETIGLMRNIKLAIDPERILNPDKIFKIDPQEPSE
ncbi:hypothetical protein TBLA_0A09080 [Henningerozyma blattae CBS 6284]|uniref:D-lactate dehydrogenase (cytochrome) n=1 Tax=Henningerozyma blattae (strain ATCC 34711 / CBS 6284 / DSM 70876 / NBRC 10599 / NRRL Y-10934 / UCD 77-7) TaxID=1071380 RepID=I2GX44_HENB6|nr:hypothetical protein TBLA_0A09080 [Tetrapisispora blattae CBS 6284]CCH58696.1 hypothetical protein TBLA_0A09080 [Tetrapisispora blattae CBS 6284]